MCVHVHAATLTPLTVQSSSAQSSAVPTSSISSSILIPTSVSGGSKDSNESSSGPIPDPGITFSTTRDGGQQDLFAAFEEAKDQPTSLPAVPPLPDKRRNKSASTPPSSTSGQTLASAATGSVTKTASGYSVLSISSEKSVDSFAAFDTNFGSGSSFQDSPTPGAEGQSSSTSKSVGSSPKLSSKFAKDQPVQGILPPPIPAPRRVSSSRRRSSNPPPVGGGELQVQSPLATAQLASSRSTSTSPISFVHGTSSNGPTVSPQHTSTSSSPVGTAVPIAVAIQETCNAIFKGNDMSKCVIKVNGEVMVSFPASFVSQLESHEALAFKLSSVDNVERLLHNQHLLKKQLLGKGRQLPGCMW